MGRNLVRRAGGSAARIVRDVVVNGVAASGAIPPRLRYLIYRGYGIDTRTWSINPGTFFGGNRIQIGSGTFINYRCFFDNAAPIYIGSACQIGMSVTILTGTHEVGGPERRAGDACAMPVHIGDGCWLGARSLIMPGVTVGDGCVIAAGAVVIRDCEPNGMYAGVPAKRVKDLAL